jgi:hypothetical protein
MVLLVLKMFLHFSNAFVVTTFCSYLYEGFRVWDNLPPLLRAGVGGMAALSNGFYGDQKAPESHHHSLFSSGNRLIVDSWAMEFL